jgi:hypothetical protein
MLLRACSRAIAPATIAQSHKIIIMVQERLQGMTLCYCYIYPQAQLGLYSSGRLWQNGYSENFGAV